MADTYHLTAIANAREGQALMTISNTSESDSFDVVNIGVLNTPVGSQSPAGLVVNSNSTISLISAYSGGIAYGFEAARSDAASLSGKVSLVTRPDSITATSVFAGRFMHDDETGPLKQFTTGALLASAISSFGHNGLTRLGAEPGAIFNAGLGDLQDITLAAGQGIALHPKAARDEANGRPSRVALHVTIDVGGSTYFATAQIGSPIGGNVEWALFNEAGSGVTVKIKRMFLSSLGYGSTVGSNLNFSYAGSGFCTDPAITFAFIELDQTPSGNAITPIPARGDAASLSGKLDVRYGDLSGLNKVESSGENILRNAVAGADLYWGLTGTPLVAAAALSLDKAFRRNRNGGRQHNSYATSFGPDAGLERFGFYNPRNPIRLNPGQTIAIRVTGPSRMDEIVHATVNYIPDPSVYPAVGDVDSGVTYGPNATDYTGTLEQPAITDVLSGVQYGAGGTEFTGTASGGGGGNTYSRGRITNA